MKILKAHNQFKVSNTFSSTLPEVLIRWDRHSPECFIIWKWAFTVPILISPNLSYASMQSCPTKSGHSSYLLFRNSIVLSWLWSWTSELKMKVENSSMKWKPVFFHLFIKYDSKGEIYEQKSCGKSVEKVQRRIGWVGFSSSLRGKFFSIYQTTNMSDYTD